MKLIKLTVVDKNKTLSTIFIPKKCLVLVLPSPERTRKETGANSDVYLKGLKECVSVLETTKDLK